MLYDVVYRSRHGEEKDGSQKFYGIPVFGVRDGKFTSHYSRTYVEAAQELDSVPEMSDAQWEALDLLAEVAEEVCMEMMFEPGDIQLINNHVIYHARTAYEDAPQGGRCLKRIWLSMPNSRALPEDQSMLWRNVDPALCVAASFKRRKALISKFARTRRPRRQSDCRDARRYRRP